MNFLPLLILILGPKLWIFGTSNWSCVGGSCVFIIEYEYIVPSSLSSLLGDSNAWYEIVPILYFISPSHHRIKPHVIVSTLQAASSMFIHIRQC